MEGIEKNQIRQQEKLSTLSEVVEKLLSSMDSTKADEILAYEEYFNKFNNEGKKLQEYFLGKILFSNSPENLPEADEAQELQFDTKDDKIESFIKTLTENKEDIAA